MIVPINQSLDFNDLKPKSQINEQLEDHQSEENQSLCRLLRVQALFGVTYCGNAPFGKGNAIKRVLLICYDILLIVIFIGAYLNAFTNDSFDRIFQRAPNKGVMNFVFKVSGSVTVLEYIVIKVMLIINGKQIHQTINSIGYVSSRKQMYFFWIFMFITSIVNSLAFALNFVNLDQTFVEYYNKEKLKAIFFLCTGINHSVVKSSILMLLLYSSLVIQRQLIGNAENFQMNLVKKPMLLSHTILELRSKIEKLNSLTGIIMLVKILSNAVQISGCVCVVAVGHLDMTSAISITGFFITTWTDIILSCRSSQLIINAMNTLCSTIENNLSNHSFTDDDYRQLQLTISLKDSFRYQVLNLFDLKDLTILSIIGYVANYAVILIQTQ